MIKNKKTAIVGGLVGIVILLTVFCCEGNKAAEEAAPAELTPPVEELKSATEEVTPAETVE